jgi:PAS domain S-box-containing protein
MRPTANCVTGAGGEPIPAMREVAAEMQTGARLEYIETLLDSCPFAIMIAHLDSGEIRYANRTAQTMLHLDQQTIAKVPAADLWVDAEEHQRFLEKFRRDGIASGEARLRRLDGRILYAQINWQYKPGSTDEVLCWSMDTTEQKTVTRQLREQERMWQRIVDHLPVALFAKDVQDGFRYTLCNRKSEELFGVAADTIFGRTDFEIFSTQAALRYREEDLEVAASGQPMLVPEELIELPSGDLFYTRTIKIAIPDEQGETSLLVGMSENVTERREAERALHASERRFRDLAESAPVGILLTDPRGMCIYANTSWQNMTGLDQRRAAGAGWLEAIHPEDRDTFLDDWLEFVAHRAEFRHQCRYLHPNQEVIWVSCSAVHFKNEAGQTVGLLGTITDITEHKRLEIQLRSSRDEAERANRVKSDFLSRMSHELRTPLNAILGFGQLLEMSAGNLTEPQKEGIVYILTGGGQLLELIEDVLDFTRIDSDHVTLDIQRANTGELIRRALAMAAPMAEKAGLTLTSPTGAVPDILTDAARLLQVLTNLLSNAIKYNRTGGTVRVLHEMLEDGMVRIAIQDSGVGIRPEHGSLIFEPFERVAHQDAFVSGTGIGLSICKRVMELLGGRIGFASEFGSGSTFWIDLPPALDPD